MKNIIRILFAALLAFVATACASSTTSGPTYVISEDAMTYAEADDYCAEMGGMLAELDSFDEMQVVYDVWSFGSAEALDRSQPMPAGNADAIWIGNTIDPYGDVRWGYVMMGGGVLIPVEQDDDEHLAAAACEIP